MRVILNKVELLRLIFLKRTNLIICTTCYVSKQNKAVVMKSCTSSTPFYSFCEKEVCCRKCLWYAEINLRQPGKIFFVCDHFYVFSFLSVITVASTVTLTCDTARRVSVWSLHAALTSHNG